MITRIKKYLKTYRDYNWKIMGGGVLLDCFLSRLIDGTNTNEYIALEFYRKSHRERKCYLTNRRNIEINQKWLLDVDKKYKDLVGDKAQFDRFFQKFVNRRFLDSTSASREEIESFIEQFPAVLAKPVSNTQGKGIQLIKRTDLNDDLLDILSSNKYALEQVIVQHHSLAEINPSSVNTVRIATAVDRNGKGHLIGAVLRCGGKGSFVDNFHCGGIAYPIDMEEGCVCGYGKNITSSERFLSHPASGICMMGFHVPNWNILTESIIEAAEMLPQMKYLGWDVAVTEEGIELVEANYGHDGMVLQFDHVGKCQKVKSILFG